ncbi:MAG TPA: SPOR domain-containing protein [Rubrivivax sp.]|nr:SPOR domain-containing protein [Rubrivivax sp.]HPO19019.1 SPOR domain-containing protein [Rubrivivax sp.]
MFKSKDPVAPADASGEAASVQLARLRARRRLIGAALLVGLGIAGFPVLFETQPRPIAVDIPIEIPQREQVAPLKLPADKPSAPPAAVDAEPAAASASAAQSPPPATGTVAAAPPAAPLAAASAASALPAASRSERVAAEPQRAPAVADPQREAQRAQAILDGKPAAAPAPASAPGKAGRFVVQAGAYTDSAALREARQKVEKLGLKTYTQVIESDAGRRTRVRVGPFDSREDAEKAAARIKSAGLAASILSI